MYNNIMENCLALEKHIIENLDYLNWFIINRFYSLKKKDKDLHFSWFLIDQITKKNTFNVTSWKSCNNSWNLERYWLHPIQ